MAHPPTHSRWSTTGPAGPLRHQVWGGWMLANMLTWPVISSLGLGIGGEALHLPQIIGV